MIVGVPPNFEKIAEVFPHVRGNRGVLFTWGDAIYVPGGVDRLTPALRAHEEVHFDRQGDALSGIERWWDNYLADPEFRLSEEIPAHQAEYRHFCGENRDPNARIRFLHVIGARLGGPLYGGLIKPSEARRRIAA